MATKKQTRPAHPHAILHKIAAGAKIPAGGGTVAIPAAGIKKNGVYRAGKLILRVRNGIVHQIEQEAAHHAADTIIDVPRA